MPGLHIALELNALAIDLEKHARLLRMQRGAQLVFKDGDLAEQLPDFVSRDLPWKGRAASAAVTAPIRRHKRGFT
jgi:hypothetical protein